MPIISSYNRHSIRIEADLGYNDLQNSTVNCQIFYGTHDPEFFIDINNPAIKTLIENKDERLFEALMDLNKESGRVLEEQRLEGVSEDS